jgi:hypothetical protein
VVFVALIEVTSWELFSFGIVAEDKGDSLVCKGKETCSSMSTLCNPEVTLQELKRGLKQTPLHEDNPNPHNTCKLVAMSSGQEVVFGL